MARHHCRPRPVQPRPSLPQCGPAGESLAQPRPSLAFRASRAADPDSVAGADGRSRHRPLRLFAGAARHARCAGLVVFRRGLHEYHQCRRLSRRRVGGVATDQAVRPVRRGALGNAGLRGVAGAVRAVRQFHRAEFCTVAGRRWRGGRISSPAPRWRRPSRNRGPRGRTSCSACFTPAPGSASCHPA